MLKNYSSTIQIDKKEDFPEYEKFILFLYNIRESQKNYALLTDYCIQEFTVHPKKFVVCIQLLGKELKNARNTQRGKLAQIYIGVFSFLCEKYGFYKEKLELDDICFAVMQPKEYISLRRKLRNYQKKSEKIIKDISAQFTKKLHKNGIKASIDGRYKNIFSVHKKCKKKKLQDISSLGDIFAFRILVKKEAETCFKVVHILHDNFIPIPQKYKDYISVPKINGYQSIHTGLGGLIKDSKLTVEVQVRTKLMNDFAESGVAAHFLYAKKKTSKLLTNKEKILIENIETFHTRKHEKQHVYCITPLGDIIRLKKGSSVEHFTEKIHSKLLKKAKYAMINDVKKPLSTTIKNLDNINIISSRIGLPI